MHILKRPPFIIFVVTCLVSVILATLAYWVVVSSRPQAVKAPTTANQPAKNAGEGRAVQPVPSKPWTLLPVQEPGKILGIDGDPAIHYNNVPWVRLGYPSCGWGNLRGSVLQNTVERYHKQGIRVLLTVCQGSNGPQLFDSNTVNALNDAAAGNPDAVQCGNEEMKQDPAVAFLYISPENFARFYDLCEKAVHKVQSDIPVLLGSLDPHVAGVDYQALYDQVNYLDQMQVAMNSLRPGSNWDWHNQTLGLIDSWHNGYPDGGVNNISGLFSFWAQQFHVDPNSGQLGKHLWVVEGTGCFRGCGVPGSSSQVAISHMLTLITDVQTAMSHKVPFFYFSGKDFYDQGIYWPIGVLDSGGKPKPIRQDLPMGARSLSLSCPSGNITVVDQEQLLSGLYSHCTLPGNYLSVVWN